MHKLKNLTATVLLILSGFANAQDYPNGITTADNLNVSDLVAQGWIQVLSQPYSYSISEADVANWKSYGGDVLLAATDLNGAIIVGASGVAAEVLTETSSSYEASSYFSSNLSWYNVLNKSIGFTPTKEIQLNTADITGYSDPGDVDNALRLSWHYDFGGYRAGSITFLNYSTAYNKVVLVKDIDSDGDGVKDDVDQCPDSVLGGTIVVDACDTGVPNRSDARGCTVADQLLQCDHIDTRNHGEYVSCVSHQANAIKADKVISGREKGAIQSCTARSSIGRK